MPGNSVYARGGGEVTWINEQVRFGDRLPDVFRRQMEQLGVIHRWLSGYFRAAGILLQIPGAAAYRWIEDETDDDLWDLIWNPDATSTLNVLAAALERLDAGELLGQVPGGDGFKRRALPVEARVRLAERDRMGLLNVVADCLDRLLVVPNIEGQAESYGLVPAKERGRKGRRKARRAGRGRRAGSVTAKRERSPQKMTRAKGRTS